MKSIGLLFLITSISLFSFGQTYFTRTGEVSFFSETPLENIEAFNNQATCIVDIATGEVVSKILIKAFTFEKALMQEHFNENYMESDKFPQAVLKATIANFEELEFDKPEKQQVILKGELTIRNITREITIDGYIQKKGKNLQTNATFIVFPSDYQIKIPKAVENNIAKEIEVSVNFQLELFNR